jgi:hypothetical protein
MDESQKGAHVSTPDRPALHPFQRAYLGPGVGAPCNAR